MKAVVLLAFVATSLAVPRPFLNSGLYPTRIVGGEETVPNEFPWQISMQYFGSHICGGSIANANTVITAAHCCEIASANAFSVLAGKHNLRVQESTQQLRQVSQVIMHPGYPGQTGFSNDICVLKLSSNLELNAAVAAVAIAPAGHTANGLATVTGWGTTREGGSLPDTLQKVDVPVVSDAECRQAYGSNMVDDSMICAGFPQGGKDSCQGDSGGPFHGNDRGAPYLAGIVSWGFGCARPGYPGVYAEVSYHTDFINSNSH